MTPYCHFLYYTNLIDNCQRLNYISKNFPLLFLVKWYNQYVNKYYGGKFHER